MLYFLLLCSTVRCRLRVVITRRRPYSRESFIGGWPVYIVFCYFHVRSSVFCYVHYFGARECLVSFCSVELLWGFWGEGCVFSEYFRPDLGNYSLANGHCKGALSSPMNGPTKGTTASKGTLITTCAQIFGA